MCDTSLCETAGYTLETCEITMDETRLLIGVILIVLVTALLIYKELFMAKKPTRKGGKGGKGC